MDYDKITEADIVNMFKCLKRGYENLKNSLLASFFMMIFACGTAVALPQDWPCEDFELYAVGKGQEWGHKFQGNNGLYEITIQNFDETENQPYIYNCGNAGCLGTLKNLETGKSEDMRFDCLFNQQKKSLLCHRLDGGTYLLTKAGADKYQVQLCGGYYKYLDISQCSACKCIIKDSRGQQVASDMEMNCIRENEDNLRCFTYAGYENWRNFEDKNEDFENCVGLGL